MTVSARARITISNRLSAATTAERVSEKSARKEIRDTFMSEGCHKRTSGCALTNEKRSARGTETENPFEFYYHGVADSARFRAPLKNPT